MRYTVRAERSGRWWSLQCVEVPGALSQVTRLADADQIREAIAFVAQVPIDQVEVDVVPVLPEDYWRHASEAARLRDEAVAANAAAAEEARAAARALHEAGVPLRDVGAILGVSHQRAHQLVTA